MNIMCKVFDLKVFSVSVKKRYGFRVMNTWDRCSFYTSVTLASVG